MRTNSGHNLHTIFAPRAIFAAFVALTLTAPLAATPPEANEDGGFFPAEMHRPRVATDLDDEIYEYLQMWEDRGYLRRPLPYLRPYPLQVIQDALEDVIARAPRRQAARAEEFLRHIDREPGIQLRGEHLSEFSPGGEYFGATGGAVQSTGYLRDNLSMSGRIGMYLIDEPEVADDAYPRAMRGDYDYFRDDSRIGALGREYLLTPSVQGVAAFGSDSVYLQAGLTRGSYGPFYDSGVILTPGAPHAGHYSFTYRSNRFTYQHLMMSLTATKDDGTARDHRADTRTVRPNKFLVLHGLTFHLTDWLDFSLHESITYGQRFDPVYLVPTSVLIYNQIYYGQRDTAFIGLGANARLPYDFAASATLYVGDTSFNDLARFNFDTRYKAAAQTGVRWTPFREVLERVSADYTFVLPYTYTHRRESPGDGTRFQYDDHDDVWFESPEYNYQNYTHHGQSLADMDPNSDRIRLQGRLRPNRFVTINLHSAFLRHANATPGDDVYDEVNLENVGTSDGSVYDSGYVRGGEHLFDNLEFLTQDTIERIIQLGFDTEITFPVSVEWFTATTGNPGALTFDFGYTFEYGWDRRPRGEGEVVQLGDPRGERLNRPTPEAGNHGARHFGRVGFSLAY